MASAKSYGSVISPNVRLRPSIDSSSFLLFSQFRPSRVSHGISGRFHYPRFVSPMFKNPVVMCAKANLNSNETSKEHAIPELNSNRETEFNPVQNEAPVPNRRYAKLHDFCLGIPFGALLFVMGSLGFIVFRSPVSLVLGVLPGFATSALGVLSLIVWKKGISNFFLILSQAAIAGFLTWQYSQAYSLTKKFMPWGFYTFLSGAMLSFFIYVVLSGGNPPPKKPAEASLS